MCEQTAQGTNPGQLAADLASGIPTLATAQARTMVQTATDTYC